MVMKLPRPGNSSTGKGALELIEEAVHLLRASGGSFLVSYYIGAIPFVLGLLYFWTDMSRGGFGHSHIASASFGMALIYIWMKCWQAVCCSQIMGYLSGRNKPVLTVGKVARIVLVQTVVQPSALFVLPVALLMAIPFGWIYAFYFSVSVVGNGDEGNPWTVMRQAAMQTILWPLQNHIVISVLMAFGFVVFLNIGITLYMLPQLLKSILGIETVFTKIGVSLFNSTFFVTACGLCYLIMNPLIRTAYTLRCFYVNSIRSGDDLKGQLRIAFGQNKVLMAILIFLLLAYSVSLAQVKPKKNIISQQEIVISPEELDHQISDVINRPEFVWCQKEKVHEQNRGVIEEFLTGIIDFIESSFDTINRWIKKVFKWINDLLPQPKGKSEKNHSAGTKAYLLYTLILIGTIAGIYSLWKLLLSRKIAIIKMSSALETEQTLELKEQYVAADQLTTDRWMNLSKVAARGELRLALRAVYLATLALLAQENMITIARFKSNRDYEKELARKVREVQPLLSLFSQQVAVFNKCWYDMSAVTNES